MRFFFIVAVAILAFTLIAETAEAKEWKRRNKRSLLETPKDKVRNKNYQKNVKKREVVSEDTKEYPSDSASEVNYNKVKYSKGKKATISAEDYKQKFKKTKNQHKLHQEEQSINDFNENQSNSKVNQEIQKKEENLVSKSCSGYGSINSISSDTKDEKKKKCKRSIPKEETSNENSEVLGSKKKWKSQKMKVEGKRNSKEMRNKDPAENSDGTDRTENVDVFERKPKKQKKGLNKQKIYIVKEEERKRKENLATQDADSSIVNEIEDDDIDVCSQKQVKCSK